MATLLDELVSRVQDPALREQLAEQVALLHGDKEYGLIFPRHLPERVKLPNHPVTRRTVVTLRDASTEDTWLVKSVKGSTATLLDRAGDQSNRPLSDLVVVRRFGEPVFPGLVSVGKVAQGGDKPWHTVINAENYHALELLTYTDSGKVDVVSIDPPYNKDAGGWAYNDHYVDKNDALRDSKWLAWMDRRLALAQQLLKDTGILLINIDDTEQAPLKMLCDARFGRDNFLAQMVWNGGRKNDSRYVSVGHDYILVYAKSQELLKELEVRWRERKPGVKEALAAAREIWAEEDGVHEKAQKRWRVWLRNFKKTGIPTDAVTRYSVLSPDGRPIRTDRDLSWPGGGGPRYDVLHPVTGKPCVVPGPGWRYPDEATMLREIAAGHVYFGKDETTQPAGIGDLEELDAQVPASVFERDRNPAGIALVDMLGDKRFPHPKNVEVVAKLIDLAAGNDAVVLDFVGGSGTTTHAVAALNQVDGGTRRSILVTNNEVVEKVAKQLRKAGHNPGDAEWEALGVFEYVTKPRLMAAFTGMRPDGKTPIPAKATNLSGKPMSDGLDENVEFFDLAYLDRNRVERGHAFEAIAPLLWLEAGARGERIDKEEPDFAVSASAGYAVLFDVGAWSKLSTQLKQLPDVRLLFVITDSPAQYQQIVSELSPDVQTRMLYEDYLENFELNTGGVR